MKQQEKNVKMMVMVTVTVWEKEEGDEVFEFTLIISTPMRNRNSEMSS